jgi:hypothetical protein
VAKRVAALGALAGFIGMILVLRAILKHMFDPNFTGSQAAALAGLLLLGTLAGTVSFVLYRYYTARAARQNEFKAPVEALSQYAKQNSAPADPQPTPYIDNSSKHEGSKNNG